MNNTANSPDYHETSIQGVNRQLLESLSYRDAGVNIDAGNALIDKLKFITKRTHRPEVLSDLGGFGALCEIPGEYKHPVLVSATDGVGTKLKLARAESGYRNRRSCWDW